MASGMKTQFAVWAVVLSTPKCSYDPQIHKVFAVKRLCEIIPSVVGIIPGKQAVQSHIWKLFWFMICAFLSYFRCVSLNLFHCVEWNCAQHADCVCTKWCEGNQGSVPSGAVVTLNKEPLLVSLCTIFPWNFDLEVVWSFAASLIRSDLQDSGAPA